MLRVCLLARFLLSNARLVVSGVQRFAMLAVGCKAGIVWLWRYQIPSQYTPAGSATPEAFTLVNATNIFFNCVSIALRDDELSAAYCCCSCPGGEYKMRMSQSMLHACNTTYQQQQGITRPHVHCTPAWQTKLGAYPHLHRHQPAAAAQNYSLQAGHPFLLPFPPPLTFLHHRWEAAEPRDPGSQPCPGQHPLPTPPLHRHPHHISLTTTYISRTSCCSSAVALTGVSGFMGNLLGCWALPRGKGRGHCWGGRCCSCVRRCMRWIC